MFTTTYEQVEEKANEKWHFQVSFWFECVLLTFISANFSASHTPPFSKNQ